MWPRQRHKAWGVMVAALVVAAGLPGPAQGAPRGTRVSIDDVTVTEGNSGQVQAIFTVTMRGRFRAGTVDYVTADGSATEAGGDYDQAGGTLTFAAGVRKQRLAVAVNGDVIDESNEVFHVSLSNPSAGIALDDGQGIGTISDDDTASALPTFSIGDATVGEGDSGTTTATFTVTLSAPAAGTVTVDFSTADGTATAAGGDYEPRSTTTLTFNEGETTKTIDVSVFGDVVPSEGSETFAVNLSNPVNATIADGEGTGTIVDDEAAPAASVSDAPPLVEGDSGTVNLAFTVTLSRPNPSSAITVDYDTIAGTATPEVDYTPASGTVTFPAGDTSEPVTVAVAGDVLDEFDETLRLVLSNPSGAVLADDQGVGTIGDDDTAAVSIDDVTLREGHSGTAAATFTVSLSKASVRPVTVALTTFDASATAPGDYEALTDTATIAAGELAASVEVRVVGDQSYEADEEFSLFITSTTDAALADGEGSATIVNDDTKTTLKVRKRRTRIRAFGTLAPPHSGRKMIVRLLKRRSGRFVRLATKRPLLSSGVDTNGDGLLESKYSTRFRRPKKGRCRVVASFRGDPDHGSSRARRTFDC